MKKKLLLLSILLGATLSQKCNAQAFNESFDDVTTLAGNGWFIQNNSTPVGSISWFQGTATTATPTPGPFDAFNGALNAYIGVNFNSTGSTGTISNWLVTPNRTLRNGDVFSFYTRKPTIGSGQTDYPDRLEVRLSTNGASTNVGVDATTVGDFTTLLLSVNPSLVVGVYPQVWTQYTITISGLPAPTSGRIAFRYFVTGAGSLGTNSDYIGIDQVDYTPYVCPTFTMTAGGALTGATAGTAYSTTLTQTGALGAPSYAITAGALPPGMTLSSSGTISGTPTATGTFNFTATVSDASGCSGSQSYSITTVCPANPIAFSTIPNLCSNDANYTLSAASPAGGTYSGTGVSGGVFSPSAGTQTITYDYTDAYGCAFSANSTITVNTNPIVTLDPLTAACEDAGVVALSGGIPAGGSYTGTGVSGTNFDVSNGTQAITYSYTDANGCSANDVQTLTVNPLPVVSLNLTTIEACESATAVTLSGESPAGGVFSGTAVSGNQINPASASIGANTVTYVYVDANGCTNSATATFTVNANPTVSLSLPVTLMCANWTASALSGGLPSGGTYSGTGVSAGQFNPATATIGSNAVTYSYTDGNGCSNSAIQAIVVDDCAGVNELTGINAVVYPNPSSGLFTLKSNGNETIENITVFDMNGKELSVKQTVDQGSIIIDLSGYTVGNYKLIAFVNGQRFETNLIKN